MEIFRIERDKEGRTTLLSYLLNKITSCKRQLEQHQRYINKYLVDGQLLEAKEQMEKMLEEKREMEEYNREFAQNCSIKDILDHTEYLDIPTVAHQIRFFRALTVSERNALIHLHSYFREAKVVV